MPLPRLPRHWSVRLSLCAAPALAVGALLLCFYLSAAPSLAATGHAKTLLQLDGAGEGQTVFTRDDGLAANSVTALFRGDRSLWVGTLQGLSRYTLRGQDAGLFWRTFTQQDGLATDAVSDLWGDEEGGLWVSHPDRQISFFDGSSWTTYNNVTGTLEQAYKQIVDTRAAGPLWAIEETAGRVWTLAEGTVGYYVGAVWRPYGADAGIPRGTLIAVWAGDGAWVASENGQVGYFDGAAWTTYGNVFDAVQRQYDTIVAPGPSAGPLWVVDQEGALWVRNAFNNRNPQPDVRRFAEGRWTNYSSGDGLANGFVAELRLDEYGRVWARHVADENGQGGGLSLYNAEPSDQRTDTSPWSAITSAFTGNVTDFWPEGTDGVWIASFLQPAVDAVPVGGLTYVALNTWERFSLEALGGGAVSDTWLDEDDTLWLGSSGLWRYRPARGIQPAAWTPVGGLLDNDVRDLWGDGRGNLWVATAGGANRIVLRNRQLTSYTQPIDLDRITGDTAGNVWAVALGEGGGVWAWDGDAWASYTAGEGLSGGVYADVHVTGDGRVYLAGDRGLDTWDGDQWQTFAALPGRYVTQVWQDSAGDLWLSTEITPGRPFNLSLNRQGVWETVLNEDTSRGMGPEPLAFLRDRRGRAWLGTQSGLYLYDPDGASGWRGLGPVEGLPRGPVPALYEDGRGTVWVAVGEQVYRTEHLPCGFGQDPLALALPQPPPSGRTTGVCWDWRVFEPQVGAVSYIAGGPEGSVLMAGEAGIALYHPDPPDLRLTGVVNLVSGEVSDASEPVVLTVGRNAVRIDLVTLVPRLTAHQIAYRYRLEGSDQDWRIAPARSLGGKRASITYAGLRGGTYTFTVAARSETLDASPEISFTLLVLSRPPQLYVEQASVGGRPAELPGPLRSFVGQPVQIQLRGDDDQLAPLSYRYRIEGLGDGWTVTTRPQISFTLSAAGTYTFVALAQDDEGQTSEPIGAQILVFGQDAAQDTTGLSPEQIAAGLGLLAALFIGSAVWLSLRRRRRESW